MESQECLWPQCLPPYDAYIIWEAISLKIWITFRWLIWHYLCYHYWLIWMMMTASMAKKIIRAWPDWWWLMLKQNKCTLDLYTTDTKVLMQSTLPNLAHDQDVKSFSHMNKGDECNVSQWHCKSKDSISDNHGQWCYEWRSMGNHHSLHHDAIHLKCCPEEIFWISWEGSGKRAATDPSAWNIIVTKCKNPYQKRNWCNNGINMAMKHKCNDPVKWQFCIKKSHTYPAFSLLVRLKSVLTE